MFRNGFGKSLGYALAGLAYALRTQANMRFHFGAALLVLVAALGLGVEVGELILLFFAVALVLVAEMFNTAVEAVVDMCTGKTYHPLAKVAKDVAAGAVLLAALNSVVVSILVFYHYLVVLGRYFMRFF